MAFFDGWIDLQKISWAVGGAAITYAAQLYRGKTKILPYYVKHTRVGITANDKTFGDVKVTLGDKVIPNLWLSEIELKNTTLLDLEKLSVAVYSGDSKLMNGTARLEGAPEALVITDSMQKALAVPTGEKPTENQLELYWRRREFQLPVFNRGTSAVFTFLSTASGTSPTIWLELVHKGFKVKYVNPMQTVDATILKASLFWGLLAAIPLIGAISWVSDSPIVPIVAAFVIGSLSTAIGMGIRFLIGKVRNLIAM